MRPNLKLNYNNHKSTPFFIRWRNRTLTDLIVYEFPLNERIRTFVRLEQLFHQINHFLAGDSIWESRAAIDGLLDVITIFGRNDIRSELLKELERHQKTLTKLARNRGIDQTKLEELAGQIEHLSQQLRSSNGKFATQLAGHGLFKSIAQRSAIPGGTCSFDLPGFHHWLQQPERFRKQDLEMWLDPFKPVSNTIGFVLNTIRHSALPSAEQAKAGFYQQNLDQTLPFQLIRVGLQRESPYFAEISGGKHRFSVRFMEPSMLDRAAQTADNVDFELTRCLF